MEEEKEIKIISPTVFSFMWFLPKKKGENFRLQRIHQWICINSQAVKTPAPGGRLIFAGNRCVGLSSLWLVRFVVLLVWVIV